VPVRPVRPTTAGASVLASAVSLQDAESLARSPAWVRYTSADFKASADIQELAAFVLTLRPRSVHDLKPMLQLTQVRMSTPLHISPSAPLVNGEL
jgi:hypothetical protein